MNALPSMLVLDFCEWMKKQNQLEFYEELDVYDLLLISKNEKVLLDFANRYLSEKYIVQGLHNFIDSTEFKRLWHNSNYDLRTPKNKNEIRYFLRGCLYSIHSSEFERAFDHFLYHYFVEVINNQDDLNPNRLVDSVRHYFDNAQRYPSFLHFMNPMKTELSLELGFLEWLLYKNGKHLDIDRMPISVFEKLVDEYCSDTNRHDEDRTKLIKSFKGNNLNSLSEKVKAILPADKVDKMKNLGYIYKRYTDENVKFRCFFLTRAKDGDEFERFIKTYWIDLHEVSDNHLDIFYGEEDFGLSGHAIRKSMKMLPEDLSAKLPCIVLWKDEMSDAKAVDIDGLSNKEIASLIEKIVDTIKDNSSLELIVEEANKMAESYRQSKRPITNNTFYVQENKGVMAGTIIDGEIIVHNEEKPEKSFSEEMKEAIEIIDSFKEVDNNYKNTIIELIKEANKAIEKDDETAQSACKSKFEGFMMGAGKAVSSIITKLAEFATIAGFFGITADTISKWIN